ncbi:FAD binding domain protein [Cordyceps fumosorosea ARSEF 2679]|uniref:FAD binding domain protein n=1 Tax=Cordyceps fumosorosea (strain ARSEF 2679) TaxID=1081104 RepID=A0A162J5C7_CORFA|nr:FAD binding domain protein [Cordyceps fumosorosea ARSEF 2679]OAA63962.1 FAD binding domain protein [Cordyceps fumosorosea ARSEF 2679]
MKIAVLSLLVSAAAQAAGQAEEASTADCCRSLADKVKSIYHGPSASDYNELVTARWSITSMQHPGCVVTPTSARDMSVIVKELAKKNCRFAVKSGGHNPNPGFNNIDRGVSIDLRGLNSTSLSQSRSYVSLGTGLSWGQAYAVFEKDKIAFTGGICEDVGVGGLAVGGGQSLFQAGKGWVVDNIIDYEVVLASGEIVHANQQNHSDLYRALKGGSTNFGIVTKIDLAAFAFDGMWGGQLLLALDGPQANREQMQQIITKTTVDFVADNHRDVDSGIQIVSTYLRNGSKVVDVALSNTANIADSPALQPFLKLPNQLFNTKRHASLAALAHETSLAIPRGFRYVTASITITNDKETLLDFWKASDAVYNDLEVKDKIDWLVSVVPQPALQETYAKARGGNVLGLQDEKKDQLVLWLVSRWNDASLDPVMEAARQAFIDAAESVAKKHDTFSPFIYLNYGGPKQDPLCGYGAANVAFMRGVAKKYDPAGVFQRLQPGGFKLSQARCA